MENRYNGWANWETWSYKLWLEESGRFCRYEDYAKTNKSSLETIANMIKNELRREYQQQIPTGFFSDVVSHAINEINFDELANAILEGVTV